MSEITEALLKEHEKAVEAAGAIADRVAERMREIYELVWRVHGWNEKRGWYMWFPGDNWEHAGEPDFSAEWIQVALDGLHGVPDLVWGTTFCDGFPRRFLFMNDEEIKAEVEAEIKDELEAARKKKETAEKAEQNRASLKKQAAAKLTKEERAALGINEVKT